MDFNALFSLLCALSFQCCSLQAVRGQLSSQAAAGNREVGFSVGCSVLGAPYFPAESFCSLTAVVIDMSVSALLHLLGHLFQRRTLFPLNLKV